MGLGSVVSQGSMGGGVDVLLDDADRESSVLRVNECASKQSGAHLRSLPRDEAAAASAAEEGSPRAARLRVLIIDDEAPLAKMLRRVLVGHEVVSVERGRDALAVLANGGQAFDLVFCDLMMPELSGMEIYARVSREHPELAERFLFMTGGAFTSAAREFLESVRAPVLEKPFSVARVRSIVEQRILEKAEQSPR